MTERAESRPGRMNRRQFLGVAATAIVGGSVIGAGTYFLQEYLIRKKQSSPTTPLPLGVTGAFVDLKDGDSVTGDIFTFGVDEQIRVPRTILQTLEATMWYAGALPDTSENPKGGWVRADILSLNTTQSGVRRFSINMTQPKPDETPVPDGKFSLSVNATGRRPDGKPGRTEGVPGPINLIYRRTTIGS